MLKIEIFDKEKVEEPKPLRLNTRIAGDGSFQVFACDENGNYLSCGVLWVLGKNGRQGCCFGIRKDLGLDLDDNDKIRDA